VWRNPRELVETIRDELIDRYAFEEAHREPTAPALRRLAGLVRWYQCELDGYIADLTETAAALERREGRKS
jgi:hypothetical protein